MDARTDQTVLPATELSPRIWRYCRETLKYHVFTGEEIILDAELCMRCERPCRNWFLGDCDGVSVWYLYVVYIVKSKNIDKFHSSRLWPRERNANLRPHRTSNTPSIHQHKFNYRPYCNFRVYCGHVSLHHPVLIYTPFTPNIGCSRQQY
jgi:hypothetical protein